MEEKKLVLFFVIIVISVIPLAYAALPPACVGCEGDAQTSAEAAAEPPSIFVFTDKSTYNHGEQIKVHGLVEDIRTGTPATLTVISPTNNIVSIDQVSVNNYGEFSIVYGTEGNLWKYDGTYTIRVQYGNQAVSNKALVELTGGIQPQFEEPEPIGVIKINIPTGAADPNAPYFWQNEKNGDTSGEVHILLGDTVKWSNADTAFHTVTSGVSPDLGGEGPDGIFDSEFFSVGESWSYRFTDEGTFPYFCMLHPWMVGTVIVGDSGEFEPEPKQRIPDWVRNIFIWYGDGLISEDELIDALRFLIQEGTIEV